MTTFPLVFSFNLLHVSDFQTVPRVTRVPLPTVSVMRRTRLTLVTTQRWDPITGSPPCTPARPVVPQTRSVSSGPGARALPRDPATLKPRGRMSPRVLRVMCQAPNIAPCPHLKVMWTVSHDGDGSYSNFFY